MKLSKNLKAKNTKRTTECEVKKFEKWCEKRKITVHLKTVSPTDLGEFLRTFFAEVKIEKGQALTPSALTGVRAAIHRHLTCAPLSRNISILQDSKLMSANKMFEAKAKLFTKENNAKPKHKSSIQSGDMQKIESILHGRAELGRRLERWGEVSRVYLVLVEFSICSPRERGMKGAKKAVILNKDWWHWSPLSHRKTYWTNWKLPRRC